MGLTFSQKFYQLPDEIYFVHFLEPGDASSARAVCGIMEVPIDSDKDLDLNILLESMGYCLTKHNLNELISEGYKILDEAGVKDRRKEFDIY